MFGKPLLFMSSYAPLFAILAVRFSQRWLWVGCLVLAGLGVGCMILLLSLNRRTSPGPHEMTSVRQGGSQAASYLAGYLLPFVTVSTPTARDVIAYSGFIIVAAVVHIRSSIIEINPLLYLFGYQIQEFQDSHGLKGYLVTRRGVKTGDKILASRFKDDVLIKRGSPIQDRDDQLPSPQDNVAA